MAILVTDRSSAAISTVAACGPDTIVLMSVPKFLRTISMTVIAQQTALKHTDTHATHQCAAIKGLRFKIKDKNWTS